MERLYIAGQLITDKLRFFFSFFFKPGEYTLVHHYIILYLTFQVWATLCSSRKHSPDSMKVPYSTQILAFLLFMAFACFPHAAPPNSLNIRLSDKSVTLFC